MMLLHDGTNHDGLFDLLGLLFYTLDTLNTARAGSVATELNEVLTAIDGVHGTSGTPSVGDAIDAVAALPAALSGWQADTTLTAPCGRPRRTCSSPTPRPTTAVSPPI